LQSRLLVRWYAQNLRAQHPKLFALPIGIWERLGLWGITSMAQENALINILAASPEFSQRYKALYYKWYIAIGGGCAGLP